MHMPLDGAPATAGHHVDPDVVGVVHDPADKVLDGVDDNRAHGRAPLSEDSAGSADSGASAGASVVSVGASVTSEVSAGASATSEVSAGASATSEVSAGASASAFSAA